MIDSIKIENDVYVVTKDGKEINTGIMSMPGDIYRITSFNAEYCRKGIWHPLLPTDDRIYIKAKYIQMNNIKATIK